MISYELIDDEELEVLKMLIDEEKWEEVKEEFGGEMLLQRHLGLLPHEFNEWKAFWLDK